MKRLRLLLLGLIVVWVQAASASGQVIDLTGWQLNTTSATGHSTDATINSYVSQIPADVHEVWGSTDYVYVKSSGVPSYDVGPFPDGNPSYPSDRNWQLRFTRSPQAATGAHTDTPLGSIGLWVNGVPMFNPKDAHSYNNQNIWHSNAVVVEADGFDAALGHPAPVQGAMGNPVPGIYHHHQLSPSLTAQLGGVSPSQFSPLLGFAFDGFPVYGPYGYANADGTGGITRMTSSYQLRNISQRHSLADGTALPSNEWGPDVSATYPLGYFVEDYEYVSGLGLLDQYNGRLTVTPDFPDGTYAYFATIDSLGNNAYPYVVGPSYYGVVDTSDYSGSVTIPGGAVQYTPGDFNLDGTVDMADYVLWRKGSANSTDYATWRSHFDATAGTGAGALISVPEPGSIVFVVTGIAALLCWSRRRWNGRTAALLARLTVIEAHLTGSDRPRKRENRLSVTTHPNSARPGRASG
ncbi:MAG TPA: YHYH protein [Lacipirellulaceae bacterium]|nr:YHYH protein [Lacipirellulaceae bacterium]